MTWHEKTRRWVKKKDGRQHWVSCRRLKKLYPCLVTAETEAGSKAAATAWWESLFPRQGLPAEYERAIHQHTDLLRVERIALLTVPKNLVTKRPKMDQMMSGDFSRFALTPNPDYENLCHLITLSIAWHETAIIRLNAQGRYQTPPALSPYDTPLDCMTVKTRRHHESNIRELAQPDAVSQIVGKMQGMSLTEAETLVRGILGLEAAPRTPTATCAETTEHYTSQIYDPLADD